MPILEILYSHFAAKRGKQYLSCLLIFDSPVCRILVHWTSVKGKWILYIAHFSMYNNNIQMRFLQGINGWDQTSAYTGATGSCYQCISDLSQYMIEWNGAWPQHWELCALLLRISCGFFCIPLGSAGFFCRSQVIVILIQKIFQTL